MDSIATVLLQEIERFNILIDKIATTLTLLQKAIAGEIIMSIELDKMYSSLLLNKVPKIWSTISYSSLKNLTNWYHDLHLRIKFLIQWIIKGPPTSYWLSTFLSTRFFNGYITKLC